MFRVNGWNKVALFDPSTGDSVLFNELVKDSCELTGSPIYTELTNSKVQSGKSYTFKAATPIFDGKTQISTWYDARTSLQAVIAGFQTSALIQSSWKLSEFIDDLKAPRSDGDNALQVAMDIQDGSKVLQKVNLLYNLTGSSRTIIFPVSGIDLTLSFDADAAGTVTIEAFDFNDVSQGSSSVTLNSGTHQSSVFTLPASTYKITVSGLSNVSNEALRTDGKTIYVAG